MDGKGWDGGAGRRCGGESGGRRGQGEELERGARVHGRADAGAGIQFPHAVKLPGLGAASGAEFRDDGAWRQRDGLGAGAHLPEADGAGEEPLGSEPGPGAERIGLAGPTRAAPGSGPGGEGRRLLWEADLERGLAEVELPRALGRKLGKGAETSWEWQHLFGAVRPLRHPETGRLCRYRPLEGPVREVLRGAARSAGLEGRVHPHLLRHCYATHLLESGVPLKSIQELMGHARLETTMIYMHVRSGAAVPASPLDRL